ncbi:MAG: (Fe-S)-binding protein [Bacteroidetes bacterium]|nr:MAG: (Fe-S)-binding protein [Bacteroidota bacterium]
MLSSILFIILIVIASVTFTISIRKVRRNILLGKDIQFSTPKEARLKNMIRVALGQNKMINRPIAGILHIFVYVGFVLINIEVMEIILDGILGTHRLFAFAGTFYNFLIAFFEILALLVFVSVLIFWARRNILKLPRFAHPDLKGFPSKDANFILIMEMILMTALMLSNASDKILQTRHVEHYVQAGSFPVSSLFIPLLQNLPTENLILIERTFWWLHIIGILVFLNYLPISKHLHIILAFPNTYFYEVNQPLGKFRTIKEVSDVVIPNFNPEYTPTTDANAEVSFGAKDVFDLNWKQLLDAYTCTECGRCTSVCPQNITGKKLSPRKIMMSVRDRLEEVGKNIDANNGQFQNDGKNLFSYISEEEIWACNTCNACAEECPVNINPLSIIMELRYNLVLEQSKAPASLNTMFSNVENNGAPWQFSNADRLKWAEE